jgi:transposase
VVIGADVGEFDMMRPVGEDLQVYLHREPIDMRRGRNGLAALAKEAMRIDPFSGALLIFIGRRYDSMKVLYWDRNEFAVWWKKIESDERYHWPRMMQEAVITLRAEQLNWLLDGYDVWAQPHRMMRFSHVS